MAEPPEFFEEYQEMCSRMDWALAGLGRGEDIAQSKSVLDTLRGFYQKWHPRVNTSKMGKTLETIRVNIEDVLGPSLERSYLSHLSELVVQRKIWCLGEKLFKSMIPVIRVMCAMPPEWYTKMSADNPEAFGKDYHPSQEYEEAEAEADEFEAEYRQAFIKFEYIWPERLDAALRDRLETLDEAGADAWSEELAELLANLKDD